LIQLVALQYIKVCSYLAGFIFLAASVSVVPDQFAVSSIRENTTLACTPSDMSLSIDWYREGSQLLTASTKYVFSPAVQSHMLTITDVQLNDAGSYYCTLADSEINNDWKIELIVVEGTYMQNYHFVYSVVFVVYIS